MPTLTKIIVTLCNSVLSRGPFIYALIFTLLLGEKEKVKSETPLSYPAIYTHIAILMITGVGMTLRFYQREICIFHGAHLAWFAFKIYHTPAFGYHQWLRLRIAIRTVGVFGTYLLYGSISQKYPNKSLMKLAWTLYGIYLTATGFILNNSLDDRWAFFTHIYRSFYSLYAVIGIMFSCSLLFFSGKYHHYASRVSAFIILIYSFLIDSDFNYWTKERHQEYWITIRLLTDNIYILCGLLLMSLK